ncbi:MAG: hypothetical protein Q8L14_04255 [Myxococcales bacterium]|nr:hypothetical protein [Myxococcales bacterium]
MRTAYAPPANGERYLTDKKLARQLARSLLPDLELLAFQTRHGPNMTKGVPYCATYSSTYLRILSVDEALVSDATSVAFEKVVLPWILKRISGFKATSYNWPCVAVILDGAFVEAACSAGGLFPSVEEISKQLKKRSALIAAVTG